MRHVALLALAVLPAAAQEPPAAKDLWERRGTFIEWISDGVRLPDVESLGRRAPRPAEDRGELLARAKERARESNRLILWHVPRTTGRQMNRATVLDGYLSSVAFCDPEIVELVKRRFVPLRMTADSRVGPPLGVKPFDFVEPGFVFLTPDGDVVHKVDRLRTFSGDWFLGLLTAVLEKHAKDVPAKGAGAADLLAAGHLAAVAKRLEKPASSAEHLLKARLLRRSRDAKGALAALEAAEKGADAETRHAVAVERGRVRMASGNREGAREALEAAGRGPRAAEAEYWLSLLDWQSGREAEAKARWEKLVRDHADSPWTVRAAGNLVRGEDSLPDGALSHEFDEAEWAPEASLGALPTRTAWPRPEKESGDVARRAVAWLLRHQRSDGSWADSRYVYCPSPKILPNVLVATTALAALALLEWRDADPAACDAARKRAEAYLTDESHVNAGQNEECYAHAYRLWYWARVAEEPVRKAAAVEAMNGVARRLAGIQTRDGWWAHEYPNAFCTAAAAQALQRAKTAGASIDEEALGRAVEAIDGSRGDAGRQPYSAGRRPSAPKDTSARSAMCDLVLQVAGKRTADELSASVDLYLEWLPRSEGVRVCDFHADGELGGFFFWHGFFHTTEAAATLPAEGRAERLAKFRAHVLAVPEWDGSFIDSHELGKSYGTAMALLSLKRTAGK